MAGLASASPARADHASTLNTYVQARIASSSGASRQASAGFAAALRGAPGNEIVASQALSHAVEAGDWPLAVRAARVLEAQNALLPDARFLLLADAVRGRDWAAARRQVEAIERDNLFAFSAPVLRAWLALGAGDDDPLAPLSAGDASGITASYAAEHRPLLLVAANRPEGPAQLGEATAAPGPRGLRLRIAAAATLAARGQRDAALALLQSDEAPALAARRLIEQGRPVPGAIDSAADGIAELLVRLSLDLHAQDVTPLAATFASLATWLAPDSSETWMVAAELAGQEDRHERAVAMLANVAAGDPYAEAVREQRIRLLIDAGRNQQALGEAEAAAGGANARASDQVRLGEVLMSLQRPADAAAAFARAIELRGADPAAYPEWALWLLRGGAHDEAGDWPQARAALTEAYRLAPTEPLVLNYLGYAQLERRENMAEAERLIREAHRLAPDNAAITDSLGWALFLKGEREEGIALLEQAARGAPADVEINEHLGDAYYAVGRRVEARFAWRAARVYAEGEDATRIDAKIETGLTPQLAAR